jgi:pimeloyl-ACP methyl ester carboxylesterase
LDPLNLGVEDRQEMWTEATVAGHLCDVFEPRIPHVDNLLVIYLHGVHMQRLTDHRPFVDAFQRHGLRVIAPLTQRSWWTDRICSEFDSELTAESHLLKNILPWIAEQWKVEPPCIGLLGTSMGGQGGLRFSYKYPDLFPVVAAIAPAIDYQSRFAEGDETIRRMYSSEEETRQDTALLHIHALNWPRHQFFCCDPADETWWDSADRLDMKLSSLGIPHEVDLETTGGGHSFQYYGRMADRAIDFLVSRLEQERRRLPIVKREEE